MHFNNNMGNSKSKNASEPEKPEPAKPCTVPACDKPILCQGYCENHQYRALTSVYGLAKNGLVSSKR